MGRPGVFCLNRRMGQCTTTIQSRKKRTFKLRSASSAGNKTPSPLEPTRRLADLIHEGHQGWVKTKERFRTMVWWAGIDKQLEYTVSKKPTTVTNWLDCQHHLSPRGTLNLHANTGLIYALMSKYSSL